MPRALSDSQVEAMHKIRKPTSRREAAIKAKGLTNGPKSRELGREDGPVLGKLIRVIKANFRASLYLQSLPLTTRSFLKQYL